MEQYTQNLINKYRNLIDINEYQKFYSLIDISKTNISSVTELFLEADINPLFYMKIIPDFFAFGSKIFDSKIFNSIPNNGIIKIGNFSFANCYNISTIKIPTSVESIGNYAFYNCKNLDSITIPNTTKYIGKDAFYGCDNLIVNVEAKIRPNGWDNKWIFNNDIVKWGCGI